MSEKRSSSSQKTVSLWMTRSLRLVHLLELHSKRVVRTLLLRQPLRSLNLQRLHRAMQLIPASVCLHRRWHARLHKNTTSRSDRSVDLGLPDGSGVELIGEVGTVSVRPDVVLGTSGDPGAADRALAAGADGFLAKPIDSLAQFQSTILSFLPRDRQPNGPRSLTAETVDPDPIALRDDLGHAAALLETGAEAEVDYVVQFLGGVARSAGDDNLDAAIGALALARSSGRAHAGEVKALRRAITDRIEKVSPF